MQQMREIVNVDKITTDRGRDLFRALHECIGHFTIEAVGNGQVDAYAVRSVLIEDGYATTWRISAGDHLARFVTVWPTRGHAAVSYDSGTPDDDLIEEYRFTAFAEPLWQVFERYWERVADEQRIMFAVALSSFSRFRCYCDDNGTMRDYTVHIGGVECFVGPCPYCDRHARLSGSTGRVSR